MQNFPCKKKRKEEVQYSCKKTKHKEESGVRVMVIRWVRYCASGKIFVT